MQNSLVISCAAGHHQIADVVKGVFERLAGDGCAILPTAFARSHPAYAQFIIWQSRLFIQNVSMLVRREMDLPNPCFCSTERRQ